MGKKSSVDGQTANHNKHHTHHVGAVLGGPLRNRESDTARGTRDKL
jgi:hypothetical protein